MKKLALALLASAALSATYPAQAIEFASYANMTGQEYQQRFNQLTGQGYRLTQVDAYRVPALIGGVRYVAIWTKSASPRPWIARHGLNAQQFQQQFDQNVAQGYRLTDLSVASEGTFAGIWQKGQGPAWEARTGLNGAQFGQKFTQMANNGFRLIDLEGYQQNGQVLFGGIWTKNTDNRGWYAYVDMTSQGYQQKFDQMNGQGFWPTMVDGYSTPQGVRYAAIWEKAPNTARIARHGLSLNQMQQQFNEFVGQGYRMTHVSGYADNGQQRFTVLWTK